MSSWNLALLAAGSLLAQQPQVVIKSTTRLVEVSVVAQDGKGRPVMDLKKDDFRVKVNGKDQPVKIFSLDSNGTLPQGETKLPPNLFTNRAELKPGQQNSVTILLLDTLNTTRWEDKVNAKAEVIRYLRTLQPSDHIGLYTLGASLRVLHDYTSDSAELLSRLAGLKYKDIPDTASKEPPDALHRDALMLDFLERNLTNASAAERYRFNNDRIVGTFKAIEFIADHLAKTPGRKNLIWVSAGFPLNLGGGVMQTSFADELNEAARAVNDANMAIYPVDARGLMTGQTDASQMSNRPHAPRMVGVANQNTMEELAGRTGGRAYYNTNDLAKAIHQAVDDSRVTYMLGFYPVDEAFDGKFHRIEVQTERKGVHLRYRKGFLDLPEFPQDEKTRKAELADAAWSPLDASGLGIMAKIVPAPGNPGSLQVLLVIDTTQVSLEQQSGRWTGRMDVLLIQHDNDGNQYNGLDDTVNLNLTAESYAKFMKNGFVYSKIVDRSARAKTMRIVVRDSTSGAIGSVTVPLEKIS